MRTPVDIGDPLFVHAWPEAARRLGVSRATVYLLVSSGQLKAAHLGRRVLIPASELERFADALLNDAA